MDMCEKLPVIDLVLENGIWNELSLHGQGRG